MPSKCKFKECKKYASYNFPGQKGRIYCKAHAKPGMNNGRKDKRCCIHPDHTDKAPRASFNFPLEKKPLYCKAHSQKGMINLNNKNSKCKICKLKIPSYGFPGKKATHCSKCATDSMVDLISNLCSNEKCRKNATYGFQNDVKASRCKTHAEDGMIDIKNKKCKLCSRQPTFGKRTKATHCFKHKTDDMFDCRHKKEICKKCSTRAYYSLGKIPTHCGKHRTDTMRDVVSRMCKKCGETQATFGFSKGNLYCKNCKTEKMKNITSRMCENCGEHQPTFNYKGIKPPRFCCGCKIDGMVDVINPMCKSCGLMIVNKKPYLCSYCKPDSKLRQKTKEMRVVNYLIKKEIRFFHNKSVGFVCGNYRPDIKIDCGTHFIIVEIDEDQHRQYQESCEVARMVNITQAEGLPCVFIRYNPDVFRVKGKVKKVHTNTRLELLTNTIEEMMNVYPNQNMSVVRLFYNNDTGRYVCPYPLIERYKNLFIQNIPEILVLEEVR